MAMSFAAASSSSRLARVATAGQSRLQLSHAAVQTAASSRPATGREEARGAVSAVLPSRREFYGASCSCEPARSVHSSRRSIGSHTQTAIAAIVDDDATSNKVSLVVRQHTISVFVADESGMINRVAGVFARRGFNIDSLAVGLNQDKAVFTVVVTGDDRVTNQVIKQLYKLVNVRKVEDLTGTDRVERELMLLKCTAPAQTRSELLELAAIFRARVVDVGDETLTLEVTGDPGKTLVLQRAMSKYGIVELARTGKIALQRERDAKRLRPESRATRVRENSPALDADYHPPHPHDLIPIAAADGQDASEGDVYPLEDDVTGVWDILDVEHEDVEGFEPHVLSLLVDDSPGVLNRVTGVFARRGYNLQSLAVGNAESPGVSRIITICPGTDESISKLLKQLYKLVNVVEAKDITHEPHVSRELMLVRIGVGASQRREVLDIASIFRARAIDISQDSLTLEVTGTLDKMAAIQDLLRPYGILQVARTGRIALLRDSGIDSKFLGRGLGVAARAAALF
eukprot:jgi/Chlat1/487/Chrsp103S00980